MDDPSYLADNQAVASRLNYLGGNRLQLVDLQDALNLTEQPLDQSEVASTDSDNSGHRFGSREAVGY